jgi:hypothetical protein
MKALASNLEMRGLKNIVYSCTELRDQFNLESASSYKLWTDTVLRAEDLFTEMNAPTKRSRDEADEADDADENDDSDGVWPSSKRVKVAHGRISVGIHT